MDRDELLRRLMGVFLEEMEEHLSAWSRDLLAVEKTADRDARDALVRSLFRTAHSLKGASRSVGLGALEQRCHSLEERLAAVRDGRLPLDPPLITELLSEGDRLAEIRARLGRGDSLDEPAAPAASPASETPPSAPPPPLGTSPGTVGAILRVPIEKLDALLAHASGTRTSSQKMDAQLEALHRIRVRLQRARRAMGDEHSARVHEVEQELALVEVRLRRDVRGVVQAANECERDLRATRMMPFEQACAALDRVVRDVTGATGKRARLAIEGGEVEIDRAVLEALRDPLVHLVRNAVVHGIETPAERRASGKSEEGLVRVAARVLGIEVAVEVSDDGAGLDREAIVRRAVERGVSPPRDPRELGRLVFLPGLSTARQIDEHAGRGVGLDVVKTRVEEIHGGIEVESKPGEGTILRIVVPRTLSTVQSLLVRADGRLFAVPTTLVRTMRRVDPGSIHAIDGRATVVIDGASYTFASLHEALGMGVPVQAQRGSLVPVVVVVSPAGTVALRVDELAAVESLMIEPLGPRIAHARNIAGVAAAAGGDLALVLSGEIVASALALRGHPDAEPGHKSPPRRLLVVDDSATTRALERTILEGAGYLVVLARDGEEAWRILQSDTVDVVVSDVEMPIVSGLELTRRIRESPRFRELPVVLLTALARDEDRLAGLQAGASAYLVKNAFDQTELLRTIERLL